MNVHTTFGSCERASEAQFLYRCDDFLPSRWLDLDRDFLLRSRDLDRLPRRRLLLETYDLERLRSLERLRDLSLPRDLERGLLSFTSRDDLLRERLRLRLSLECVRDFLLRERERDDHFLLADSDLERRELRERDLARLASHERERRFLVDRRSLDERDERER